MNPSSYSSSHQPPLGNVYVLIKEKLRVSHIVSVASTCIYIKNTFSVLETDGEEWDVKDFATLLQLAQPCD